MKIVHLTNTDSGGAIELHKTMLAYGIDSTMLVKGLDLGAERVFKISNFQRIKSNIGHLLSAFILPPPNPNLGLYSFPLIGAALANHKMVKEADVIYLHFVAHASFLSLQGLKSLLNLKKPVIFVTRDMWPITGGCHTFLGCIGYQQNCANCPHFTNAVIKSLPAYRLNKKHELYKKKKNLHFLGISKWCADVIRQSTVAQSNFVHTISNPIDTDCFVMKDRDVTRALLGLPLNKILIGFGARSLNNPLKGTKQLQEAFEQLRNQGIDFEIVTFGKGELIDSNFTVHNLGVTRDLRQLSLIYNSLDVFASPSFSETFGNTVAEAMACGTPVVGFRIGGVIDIIDHKVNGYLAESGSNEDIANGIRFLLSQPVNEIRLECRKKIVTNFSRKVIINQHIDFLNTIISQY